MKKIILLSLVLTPLAFSNSEALEALGERLFNDIRFSQQFYSVSEGDVNTGHETSKMGQMMSCSSCHMVDQKFDDLNGGMRGYNDFNEVTPVPIRNDNTQHTLRNTPTLVGIGSKYAQNRFSHYDGEFHDHAQTVLGNFTGRNMGWKNKEKNQALKNIVNILKLDDGRGELALEFGGPYKRVLLGIDPALPEELRLPPNFTLDTESASDAKIIGLVIKAVTAYMNGLDFDKNEEEVYQGSAYDEFLKLNSLSQEPLEGESILDYTNKLVLEFKNLKNPKFVKSKYYETHKREFKFQENEWQGLKVFFNMTNKGMCLSCHMPPLFTDQEFHNIGTAQLEYNKIHGEGLFEKLVFPSENLRLEDQYLLDRPSHTDPTLVDLGMWNFFGRKGKEVLTKHFKNFLCVKEGICDEQNILPFALGRIKTPTLRNLNHSAPYLHTGKMMSLEEVIDQYDQASKLAIRQDLRNGARELKEMELSKVDKENLKLFLDSLNSEYD